MGRERRGMPRGGGAGGRKGGAHGLLVAQVLVERLCGDGPRGFDGGAHVGRVRAVGGVEKRGRRAQGVDGEKLVGRVARGGRNLAHVNARAGGGRWFDRLVEALVVEENVPFRVVFFEGPPQGRRRLRGHAGEAAWSLRRRSGGRRDGEEDVQLVFDRLLQNHGPRGLGAGGKERGARPRCGEERGSIYEKNQRGAMTLRTAGERPPGQAKPCGLGANPQVTVHEGISEAYFGRWVTGRGVR